jgi:hypothetical protein
LVFDLLKRLPAANNEQAASEYARLTHPFLLDLCTPSPSGGMNTYMSMPLSAPVNGCSQLERATNSWPQVAEKVCYSTSAGTPSKGALAVTAAAGEPGTLLAADAVQVRCQDPGLNYQGVAKQWDVM